MTEAWTTAARRRYKPRQNFLWRAWYRIRFGDTTHYTWRHRLHRKMEERGWIKRPTDMGPV